MKTYQAVDEIGVVVYESLSLNDTCGFADEYSRCNGCHVDVFEMNVYIGIQRVAMYCNGSRVCECM